MTTRHQATAIIVSAYLARWPVPLDQIGGLTVRVASTLHLLEEPPATAPTDWNARAETEAPLSPIDPQYFGRPQYQTCLHCAKQFTVLTMHLKLKHRQTPGEYREQFKLPADYPMQAPGGTVGRNDKHLNRHRGRLAARIWVP